MTPPRSECFVHMTDAEFEAILTRAADGEADQKNVQWTFCSPNAKRALADVGLDGDEAALGIRDALLGRPPSAGASDGATFALFAPGTRIQTPKQALKEHAVSEKYLVIDPEERLDLIKALASPVRVGILKLLGNHGPKNVNQIAEALGLPQSTISSNLQSLENVGLVATRMQKARKGSQKVCESAFSEILVAFRNEGQTEDTNDVKVSMPIGLYTQCEVSAPCGLCSPDGIIGLLDVPDTFLDPARMKAGLLWFNRGFVEFQFPNNARLRNVPATELEFSLELSSEVPGTSIDWPSDIALEVNGVPVATWTSPGDYGDKRGVLTPDWWKLNGSQYGMLKAWRINGDGSYVDGVRVSDVTLADLQLDLHRSIRMRIGVREDAEHPGGINIFGRGFGNYDQDIVMRLR